MKLQFYFDYISPNAYLAWHELPALLAVHGIEVEPVPVLFSAILEACGQRGPAEIPSKMQWMVRNILRKARRLNIPLKPPRSHPFNPLLPLRVSCVPLPAERKAALVDAIFAATWANGVDVSSPTDLVNALEASGVDTSGLMQQAGLPETKAVLRENTSAAIQRGIFGVPSMVVKNDLFWGYDDFADLDAFLTIKILCPMRKYRVGWRYVRARRGRVFRSIKFEVPG